MQLLIFGHKIAGFYDGTYRRQQLKLFGTRSPLIFLNAQKNQLKNYYSRKDKNGIYYVDLLPNCKKNCSWTTMAIFVTPIRSI